MQRFVIATLAVLVTGPVFAQRSSAAPAPEASPSAAKARQLSLAEKPWIGDFDRMVERRMIRVDAPLNRRSMSSTDAARSRCPPATSVSARSDR